MEHCITPSLSVRAICISGTWPYTTYRHFYLSIEYQPYPTYLQHYISIVAICLSGSSAGYYGAAVPGAVARSSEILGTTFGCADITDSQALVDCLREQDANDLNWWAWTAIVEEK